MNKKNAKIDKVKVFEVVIYIVGCLVLSIAINIFLVPNTISTGGATGVGVVMYKLFKIPVSFTVLALNIPLFLIAFKEFGVKFCIKALIGTGLLIFFMQLTSGLTNIEVLNITNDVLLASIFGGVFSGIGMSLVFKAGGSTGGTDLLAQIIYKKRPISSMGQVLLILDGLIVLASIIATKSVRTRFVFYHCNLCFKKSY